MLALNTTQVSDLGPSCFISFRVADISLLLTNSQDVDFEFILPAVNMGCSALEMLYQKSGKKETLTGLVKHLQGLSQQARLASRHQVCVFVMKIVYSRSLYPATKFKGYRYGIVHLFIQIHNSVTIGQIQWILSIND